jgi:hypothetical protein
MLTEVKYRTFDDLLDSVRLDLHVQDAEGMIEPQALIKVARNVNYDLGLKVNPNREKLIEIHKGKAKLPLDFNVLNFAVLCEGKKVWDTPGATFAVVRENLLKYKIHELEQMVEQHRLPTFMKTISLAAGDNVILHNLQTTDIVVQLHREGEATLAFEYTAIDGNQVQIHTDVAVTSVRVVIIGVGTNTFNVNDKSGCQVGCEWTPSGPKITERTMHNVTTYERPVRMQIEKNKAVAPECMNGHVPSPYRAAIKNNFLDTNVDEGTIYINYQSLMEDDEGNLLVMDNERVNEYYEYALKQRIFENMIYSGENAVNLLQMTDARLRGARNNALSYVNTPDFHEMRHLWEMNRRAMSNKYIDMFKSRI